MEEVLFRLQKQESRSQPASDLPGYYCMWDGPTAQDTFPVGLCGLLLTSDFPVLSKSGCRSDQLVVMYILLLPSIVSISFPLITIYYN